MGFAAATAAESTPQPRLRCTRVRAEKRRALKARRAALKRAAAEDLREAGLLSCDDAEEES